MDCTRKENSFKVGSNYLHHIKCVWVFQMRIYVGLAYSNVQNEYNLPSVIVGIKIGAKNLNTLKKLELDSKEKIFRRVLSSPELSLNLI